MRARNLGSGEDKRGDDDEEYLDPVRLPFGARLDRDVTADFDGLAGIFFFTTTRSILTA